MKTIGQMLLQERKRKKISLESFEKLTKIRKEYLAAIEKEQWGNLPDFSTVSGFVKSMTKTLGIAEGEVLAKLRRDYPPRSRPTPSTDVSDEFTWSPKLTFISVIILSFLAILVYLGVQYYQFKTPPSLSLTRPKDGEVVAGFRVRVAGETDPEASVYVNNQPVLVNDSGKFEVEIKISEATEEIVVRALSRSGKVKEVRRRIVLESKKT